MPADTTGKKARVMQIDLVSFIFGAVLMLALVICVDRIYTSLWGSKKTRSALREARRLKGIIRKKDELINKSIREMKKIDKKEDDN